MPELDRRQAARVQINEPVVLHRSNGARLPARCENLSFGGGALLIDSRLYLNERVELEAPFLAAGDRLLIACRVAYVVGLTHPPGMLRIGIEFLDADESARARIGSFIHSRQPLAAEFIARPLR